MGGRWSAGIVVVAVLGLAGCGERASAVETREREAAGAPASAGFAEGAVGDGRTGAGSSKEAAPAMTGSRRETADVKVERLYRENGADFGARSADDFAAKVQAFVKDPPAGTERVERPNGDVLLYHASSNTFAVVSRDGAPRTMFKPRDGSAYWAEQKAAAPEFGRRRREAD